MKFDVIHILNHTDIPGQSWGNLRWPWTKRLVLHPFFIPLSAVQDDQDADVQFPFLKTSRVPGDFRALLYDSEDISEFLTAMLEWDGCWMFH